MTNPYLALESVSQILPDGRTLFSDLNATFDQRHTGLVGRNGVGKTLLARILAGQIQPSSGRCLRTGSVHYLAQQVSAPANATVASLAGVQRTLAALARIEAGSSAPADFDAVGDHWNIRQQLASALEQHHLEHLRADTPANNLSGGEAMRIALIGALLSDADFLILDEPSNHLDRPHRRMLIEQLQQWPRGLLVISHDRQLLDTLERTVELSSLGLRSHGGNYTFYATSQAQEQQNALRQLEHSKLQRQREEQAMRDQRERQARRQAGGKRLGKEANQAKILLDRQKERSEGSAGRLRQKHDQMQQQLDQQVRTAAQQVAQDQAISLHALPVIQTRQRLAVELTAVTLPFITSACRHIDLAITGQQRVGIIGPNGCGKSTLLKVITGQIEALAGIVKVTPGMVYLDQRLAQLDPEKTVLEQLQAHNPGADIADLRTRLVHLGLDARKITLPSGSLSGGERLKAALACVLYAEPPPSLLLLDEPSNHLDLPSAQALETMLQSYRGALVVVSHDDVFMGNLGLTDRLVASADGWRLSAWDDAT